MNAEDCARRFHRKENSLTNQSLRVGKRFRLEGTLYDHHTIFLKNSFFGKNSFLAENSLFRKNSVLVQLSDRVRRWLIRNEHLVDVAVGEKSDHFDRSVAFERLE